MADAIQQLCELFAEVLEVEYVTSSTDFFLAGGHSLSAVTLAMTIEQAFGVRTRARDIFECATPEHLAAWLAEAREAQPAALSGGPADLPAPEPAALPGQAVGHAIRWLWLERQRGRSAPSAYTVACLYRGAGDLDLGRLTAAIATLPVRHPGLGMVFVEVQGIPRAVMAGRTAAAEVVDLRAREVSEAGLQALVHERIEIPFDPAAGPLFRPTVFLCPGGAWSLLFVADHLVCDGRSWEILAGDVVRAYARPGLADPAVAGPGAPSPARPSRDATLDFWRRLLTPLPAPLPLPILRPRLEPVGDAMGTLSFEITRDLMEPLRVLAREAHAGLFVPLAAAVARALSAVTGSPDVCLGTAVDRRSHLGLDKAAGFHIATVPLLLTGLAGLGSRALIDHVATRTLDALDHSEVTLDELVAALDPPRADGRHPFFDVWVALYPYIRTVSGAGGGIALHGGPVVPRYGLFELSFLFVEHADGLRLVLQYDAHRYDQDTVTLLGQQVISALGSLAVAAGDAMPDDSKPTAEQVFKGFRFPDSSAARAGDKEHDS